MGMRDRRVTVAGRAAQEAASLEVPQTGLWFDDDIRRNFYLAIHMYAASTDLRPGGDAAGEPADELRELACTMITRVLRLQNDDATHPMYGHWPISVSPHDLGGVANHQPGELMLCVLVLFRGRYHASLPPETLAEIDVAISRQHETSYARSPLDQMHHHDATHVAQCLLLGHRYGDASLMKHGLEGTRRLLGHLRTFGFKEYGGLPWFWHWIQAFSCVWEVLEQGEARDLAEEMLAALWGLRVDSYLRGAWVGARSRQWPHDIPTDTNVAMDFIQFGDFPLGRTMPRLEGSALFSYEVPGWLRERAVDRSEPTEIKKRVLFATADRRVQAVANLYTYITSSHAVGGVWERKRQFDNEQHRWDVALPITDANVDRSVNHAYFFHPGAMYDGADLRHQSTYGDVLFYKDTVIEMWKIPQDDLLAHPDVLGCLPHGEWLFEDRHAYGRVEDTYMSVHLMGTFTSETQTDRILVRAPISEGGQGVIFECTGRGDAQRAGVETLEEYKAHHEATNRNMYRSMITKTKPYFSSGNGVAARGTNDAGDDVSKMVASYITFTGAHLLLERDALGRTERFLDGSVLTSDSYPVEL